MPDAIAKAGQKARKEMIRVPLTGSTITHEVIGRYGPTQVIMKPAGPGTGVIAGSVVRAIVEAAGISDIRTKVVGSNNPHNGLEATMSGLLLLKDPEQFARVRGKSLEDLGYAAY